MLKSGIAATTLVALLSGCAIAPDVDQQASRLSDNQLGLHGISVDPATAQWWQAYADPQLNRLIELALQNNPDLSQSLSRLRAARAQTLAAGAPLQPQVDLSADATRQRLSENYIYPSPYAGSMRWFGDMRLGLNWALDFWGRQDSLLSQAESLQASVALNHEGARQALSGAVVEAYLQYYRAERLLAIAEASEAQRQSLVKLTRGRVDAGLDTELELKNAETLLPQARQAKLQAQTLRDLAVHQLVALCGDGAEAYATIEPSHLSIDAGLQVPDELPLNLLARRPDLLAARAQVDAASAGKKAARAAYYPQINLTAFAGFQAIGLDDLTSGNSKVYGVGPTFSLPIFDGQRLDANYQGASADLDLAIETYNAAVVDAIRDVADQITKHQSLQQQKYEAAAALQSAEGAWTLAKTRYEAGLTGQLVVLDAESRMLDARRNMLAVDVDLASSEVELLMALGGSFLPQATANTPA